jgi:hypothetical protein
MPKMTEEQRLRRAAIRARREALAAEEDELRLEQRRQQWIDQGALTRAELEAGEPCRGCRGPIFDGLGSWPAMMHMTEDERRDYDQAATLYRDRHGGCRSHRWSMSQHHRLNLGT